MCWWTCRGAGTRSLLVGMKNGTITLEDSLAVSCKSNHRFTIWRSSCTPRHLPNWWEMLCPHKSLHTNIYSRFIFLIKLEATKMSFNKWMDKQWYTHTMEHSSAVKRNKLWENRFVVTKGEEGWRRDGLGGWG